MAARRCGLCDISYPAEPEFQQCPVHGKPTQYLSALAPDEFWDWKATQILVQTGRQLPRLDASPKQREDGLFEVAGSLMRYVRLGDHEFFDVVVAGAEPKLWEVVAHFAPRDVYIVRPVIVPDALPDGD